MNDHLVSPEMEVTVGPSSYKFDPSFRTLKALQHVFQTDLVQLQAQVIYMRQDEIAKFIDRPAPHRRGRPVQPRLPSPQSQAHGLARGGDVAEARPSKKSRRDRGDSGEVADPTFPWTEYQQFALGGLGWSPSEFWAATAWELSHAWEGYAQANGLKSRSYLDDDTVVELRDMMDAELAKEAERDREKQADG